MVKLSENDGVQSVRPFDPPLGGQFPPIDSAPISANNEPICTILVSFYWSQMMSGPFLKRYK